MSGCNAQAVHSPSDDNPSNHGRRHRSPGRSDPRSSPESRSVIGSRDRPGSRARRQAGVPTFGERITSQALLKMANLMVRYHSPFGMR